MRQMKPGLLASILMTSVIFADAHSSSATTSGPTPDQAYKQLLEGHTRYAQNARTLPHQDELRRCETTTGGQHPVAAVLSCADSRVPPEMLFDQGIGDLFVIRVAGNVAATDELGTLEYGVEHLRIPLIVVLGHSRCGAVTAVVDGAHAEGNLAKLLQPIAPAAQRAKQEHPSLRGQALVGTAIEENVRQAISDLTGRSPVIAKAVQEKRVKIVGGVYDIHSGRIDWLEQESLAAVESQKTVVAESAESHSAVVAPANVAHMHDADDDHVKNQHAVPAPVAVSSHSVAKPAVIEAHDDAHAPDAASHDAPVPAKRGKKAVRAPENTHTAEAAHETEASDSHNDSHGKDDADSDDKKPQSKATPSEAHASSMATITDHWPVLTGMVVTSTLIGAGVTHFASRNKSVSNAGH